MIFIDEIFFKFKINMEQLSNFKIWNEYKTTDFIINNLKQFYNHTLVNKYINHIDLNFLNKLLSLIVENNDVDNLKNFIEINPNINYKYHIDNAYNFKFYEIFKLLINTVDDNALNKIFHSHDKDKKFVMKCYLEKEYDYFFLLFQKSPLLVLNIFRDIKRRYPDFTFPKAQSIIENYVEKKINFHDLIKNISSNNINEVIDILKKEIDVSICDNYAFIISLYYENIEIIKLLLINIYDIDKLFIDIKKNSLFINQVFLEKIKPMIDTRKDKIKEILELKNKIKELENTF